jgi:hypothetical protein
MSTKDLNILGLKVTTANSKKDLSLVTGYNSYVQKIENICKTNKGELPSNINLGSDYYTFIFNPVGNKQIIETNLEAYIKNAIYDLTNIVVKVASFTTSQIILNISFSVKTGLTKQQLACTIEVDL